ncbi:penicillin-insensitive murein endopeptidase [Photobacterium sp. SKA34]|uniref:penicillin-insensitive murein endopeptidase n=1 Tax=Photobacterium sp. SKA34 TaxID=121723 RepID=UPI00006BDF6E|nr:penicillin-insensitive murein endopeptidase [Photobacterium sp. SKA34]EAR56923.1 penicillin-insensitive murein endopeptidase [Photobacterium sp. SKA34]
MLGKFLTGLLFVASSTSVLATPWEKVKTPTLGESMSIGSYSNGCLAGAEALPLKGDGYQVIRAERGRYYGNHETITFLKELMKTSQQLKIGNVLVGDIAMPRGGRFSSGHASHQTGLDADIWLRIPEKPLSQKELKTVSALPMVDVNNYKIIEKNWSSKQAHLIQLAASDDRVARIFVHPVIKEQLCKTEWKDRDWLRKVRPWYGHYYHFHVRLNCPEGSAYCEPQTPPPPGDGCGKELASWAPDFKKPESNKQAVKPKPKPKPVLPAQCKVLINS